MNIFRYIDSYEKALVFWLCMIGGAFGCIIVGIEIGELLEKFLKSF